MDCSVVIATRDRPALLQDTLASLLADASGAQRELIVVDNGRGTAEPVVEAARRAAPGWRIVYDLVPVAGKSRSLNRGVDLAQADHLLFTDDDVVVQPGWVDALLAGFDGDGVGAVGGRTLPLWPAPPPGWLAGDQLASLGVRDLGEERREAEPRELIGANLALARDAIRGMAEPFSLALGPKRDLKMDYEEYHLVSVIAGRHRLVYQPAAVVLHRIAANRLDFAWMRRTYFQRGCGFARTNQLNGTRYPSSVRTAVWFARAYTWATRTRLRGGPDALRTPAAAARECEQYFTAGEYLQAALRHFPHVAAWAAGRLA